MLSNGSHRAIGAPPGVGVLPVRAHARVRDGLSKALERCGELGATLLVVEKADRLGRDLIVSEMAVRAFADVGVSIVTADTGENITEAGNDPSRKLIRQVLNAVAEYDRSALVAKLRAARERKRRNGGHAVGCYRFGEHPERPQEAETLARLCELRRCGTGRKKPTLRELAQALNGESRESRTGRPWTPAMVRDVLPGLKRRSTAAVDESRRLGGTHDPR